MTSTDYQNATRQGSVDEQLTPDAPARKPISSNRLLGSLKEAVRWPGADRNTMVTLALSLVAARADEEGSSYFQELSDRNPADPTAEALAGFFQVRAGDDVAAAVAKLDKAATLEPGLTKYFCGLALSELLPGDGAPGVGLTNADTARADQVTAAATLAGQGDLALALEILDPGLLRHPDSNELADLRQAVLVRLMEQRQLLDLFGFAVYAQLTGAELAPVG